MRMKLLGAVLASLAMAACGGGGDGPADVAEKYVGTWASNCSTPATGFSVKSYFNYTKKSATALDFSLTNTAYENGTCTGAPQQVAPATLGTIALVGTQAVGTDTADKLAVTLTASSGITRTVPFSFSDIALIKNGELTLGKAVADPKIFPTELNTAFVLTKFVGQVPVPNITGPIGFSTSPAPVTSTPPTTVTTVTGDVADKYVGTWSKCTALGAASSFKVTIIATRTSATSIAYTYTDLDFATVNCTGASTPFYSEEGTVAYKGTKTIGADTVDMGEGTITKDSDATTTEPRTEKDISLVLGNTLYFGDDNAALGADGYPTAIFKAFGLTKQ
jgi:hypothetical protein